MRAEMKQKQGPDSSWNSALKPTFQVSPSRQKSLLIVRICKVTVFRRSEKQNHEELYIWLGIQRGLGMIKYNNSRLFHKMAYMISSWFL